MEKFTAFGVRELWVAPIISEDTTTGETVYGTLTRAVGVESLSVTPNQEEYTLEGDDMIVEVKSQLTSYGVSFTNGVLDFTQLSIIEGGKYDVLSEMYVNNEGDKTAYFGVIGRVVTNGEKDLKVVLPKVKATSVEIGFTNKEFAKVNCSGTAIKDAKGDLRRMFKDTAAITAADLTKNIG